MIQIAIAAFLVWAFFKVKEKNGDIDGFAATSLILVPAIIVFVGKIAITSFAAPIWLAYVLELSYFVAPFLLLKNMTKFSTGKIAAYSAIVLVINFITQVLMVVLFGMPKA